MVAVLGRRPDRALRIDERHGAVGRCGQPLAALTRHDHIAGALCRLPLGGRLKVLIRVDAAAVHVGHQLVPHQVHGVRLHGVTVIVVLGDGVAQEFGRFDFGLGI